jgi:glutathione synthase/RimK-type ligase-like ATP-grasp enzyme
VKLHANDQAGVVALPAKILSSSRELRVSGTVAYGQREVAAVFTQSAVDGRPLPLALGQDVLSALGLRSGARLLASWDSEEGRLRLGPVVAVFVWRSNSPGSLRFLGPVTDFVRMFVRLCRRRGVVAYAFTARDIDWETGTVQGFVPVGRSWRRSSFPLPDVVYDRLQSRRLERLQRYQQCKERLQALPKLHYFNPSFLDKWDVHQALQNDSRARRYLPRTDKLTSISQLGRWLRAYSTVYVKPTRGSLGLGVTKVSRIAHGYRYQRVGKRGRHMGLADSLGKLEKRLHLSGRRMIVQQGLHLARYGGRPYDIRVMVQKTPRGRWVCTNMIARVASSAGSAVSNVATGGSMVPARKAIRNSLRLNSLQAARRVRRGARVIARALEEQLGQEFGEFGVDMALDIRGRLWLIEVNAKPGRENDNLPGVPPSVRRIVRYAISRAGFR